MINPFQIKNYHNELAEYVTTEFRENKAPVFNRYLKLFSQPSMDIQDALRQLMQDRSIDTAVGVQLDIIGNIVGQPREFIDAELIDYFSFVGVPNEKSYGDLYNPKVGGYYFSLDQSRAGNVLLNDDQYRLFIKAKIIKNVTRATPEDVISFIKFVFNVNKIQITLDEGANQVVIMVSDSLNLFERALLTYFIDGKYRSYFVPKALGVGYKFGIIPDKDFFSYAGVVDGKGYGMLNELTGEVIGGGRYATLI